MYRQGDVLIRPVSEIPENAKKVSGRKILAEGEHTGHAHVMTDRTSELLETEDGRRFLRLVDPGVLEHDEHSTLTLDPGLYEVKRQREYFDERSNRPVCD